MKAKNQEYIMNFLMQSSSLKDLLGILKNISENLDLDYLNPRIKHFKYFQFTFFGLMVKVTSLLEMIIYRAEFLKKEKPELEYTYQELLLIKKKIERAFALIKKNKMVEGKKQIIIAAKEYQLTFDRIIEIFHDDPE
jgi:hypothetical protein